MSDDESFCQDVNECEIYDNDDDDEVEEEAEPRASFCSHTCTNLIGSPSQNIWFSSPFIIFQHQNLQEVSFVPVLRTFTFTTTNEHAFVTIVLIWTIAN